MPGPQLCPTCDLFINHEGDHWRKDKKHKLPKQARHAIEAIDKTMKHGWASPLGDNTKGDN